MIPSVLSSQLQDAVGDFLKTTYPFSTPEFKNLIPGLVDSGQAFKGPFFSLQLPFRTGAAGADFFPQVPLSFPPYLHQERAFERLSGDNPQPTIVATGTGSGKTESFLLPILDYCRRNASTPGIKAILIYPMNALATDQARRIAKIVHEQDALRGHVTAGLYIGSKEAQPSSVMTAESIVTDRASMRMQPPDILLTNYKMLDYLMVRPRDAAIWAHNEPGALRFLVVDELHTFDGAQGTDLACLIRRLKSRLETPDVCCIGTSATLGDSSDTSALQTYAGALFDQAFDESAIITEDRLSAAEFLADVEPTWFDLPLKQAESGRLDAATYERDQDYIAGQTAAWFGNDSPKNLETHEGRVELSQLLRHHDAFRVLIELAGNTPISEESLLQQFAQRTGIPDGVALAQVAQVVESLLALVSHARLRVSSGAGKEIITPLVNTRSQVWMRELRRMVASVAASPHFTWADDLQDDGRDRYLPVVHCRDCGCGGWVAQHRQNDPQLVTNLQSIYNAYFGRQPSLRILFPDHDGALKRVSGALPRKLCGECITLNSDRVDSCETCGSEELVSVVVPDYVKTNEGRSYASVSCPSCQSRFGLNIVGSQAASLTSVIIGQLYASSFNDDKKLLTFSDSVQDASHRAGFFQSRTYRFTVRSALQQFVDQLSEPLPLADLASSFVYHLRQQHSPEDFVATFIAPDMTWMEAYERFVRDGVLGSGSSLEELVARRVHWEVCSEYGFRSRIGRTLERTAASAASPDSALLEQVSAATLLRLREEIGGLTQLREEHIRVFLQGFINRLRQQGGIHHPALAQYVAQDGNTYLLNKIPYMPPFGRQGRAPAFLTSGKKGDRFDRLPTGRNRTWYATWAAKCFRTGDIDLPEGFEVEVYRVILPALEGASILVRKDVLDHNVWGLTDTALHVHADLRQLHCSTCSNDITIPASQTALYESTPCMRDACSGHYVLQEPSDDYYRRLYKSADIRRINASEHTGLLERDDCERLETRFINGDNAWDPNLISCTPTLEMGIDIGDLSSLILCSVPPNQSSYLQRIGRAGRRDGNALAVTMANAKPHDLYFFAQPEEMIASGVEPPGTFLDAPAVLERQLSAFTLDRWVASGVDAHAVPATIKDVMSAFAKKDETRFPFTWLNYVREHQDQLLPDFLSLFREGVSESSKEHLQAYLTGDGSGGASLAYRVAHGLQRRISERESIRKKADQITGQIKKLKDEPQDQNFDTTLGELEQERAGLRGLVRNLDKQDAYGFLSEEGLLPNYAFPEEGVTLKSVIYRKKETPDEGGAFESWSYQYERAAGAALSELAPEAEFYATGRKVEIDQVDLDLSEVEVWRFCSECNYSERHSPAEEPAASCPLCEASSWSDVGRLQNMVRLRQVFARSEDRRSRTYDDAEEREQPYYERNLSVTVRDSDIEQAFALEDKKVPYGFEYVRRADFREINFGLKGAGTQTVRLGGVDLTVAGFSLCADCGKVQKRQDGSEHTYACPRKNKDNDGSHARVVYLYREFSSEAIRMLLPFTSAGATELEIQSFIAALYMGLKRRFGGQIDHLRAAVQEDPIEGTWQRRYYLFLYDVVPGGTGYLKELMRDPDVLMDIFDRALSHLISCSCNEDPQKDGCYRCIYAYRHSRTMDRISRGTAVSLFSSILEYRDQLRPVQRLSDVDLSVLLQGELEKAFILKLEELCGKNGKLTRDMIRGKEGYILTLPGQTYHIELQASLGEDQGVLVPSLADFVFRPVPRPPGAKDIVVFTDGYEYHHARLGTDTAQRMALLRAGSYQVFSITWEDLHNPDLGLSACEDYIALDDTRPKAGAYLKLVDGLDKRFGTKQISDLQTLNGMAWLWSYLQRPLSEAWASWAFAHGFIYLSPALPSATWTAEVNELAPDFVFEKFPSTDAVGGLYQRVRKGNTTSEISIACSISKEDLQAYRLGGLSVVARLDDSSEARNHHQYSHAWRGFLRLFNLFQFLPEAFFTTSSGLSEHLYDALDAAKVDESEFEWETALASCLDEDRTFLLALQKAGVAAPVMGHEFTADGKGVIATAEMAWPQNAFCLLGEYDVAHEKVIEDLSWQHIRLKEAKLNPEAIIDRLI